MIFKGKLNYAGKLSGLLEKYDPKLLPENYAGKIIYLERSINSILDYLPYIKGIILKEGGVLSHVAIVSREFNKVSILNLDLNEIFSKMANINIENGQVTFSENNYLVPTKIFVGLFNKANGYYLIYNDIKKITLNKSSYNLIKDLQSIKIKNIEKKYGVDGKTLIENLLTDKIFCFSAKPQRIPVFESNADSPDILDLQITTNCNMNCKFCYADVAKKIKTNLSFKEIKKLINCAKELGFCFISITGGEPTLHPDFCNIVDYIKTKGFVLHININGTIINDDIISRLSKANSFGISFDSLDEKDFLFLRGSSSENIVFDNIKKLISNGLSPTIVIVVSAINVNKIDAIICRLSQLGIKKIKLNYFLPIGAGKQEKKLFISYSKYIELYSALSSKYSQINILFDTMMFAFRFGLPTKKMFKQISCGAFRRRISVNAQGDLNGCLLLSDDFIIGNIKKDSILTILSNNKSSFPVADLETPYCKKCVHYENCGLGCPAFYKINKGILDPRCPEVESHDYKKTNIE